MRDKRQDAAPAFIKAFPGHEDNLQWVRAGAEGEEALWGNAGTLSTRHCRATETPAGLAAPRRHPDPRPEGNQQNR